ncbi:cytochrome c biogenesis protein ResB [Streptomyces sp. XD-27]|uniref:cytochrome c biogenesis protein ResB n=1 Tax=Streptomyces sp. XD-27 TaxID=3062779 RepID=UPI0026F477DF|nr:cytochrome c biogenesis protein ResB [Streptomyces sp. XD-27]WKX71890.1 cytochrome c biogenesis protein ResB [Streptomyces sp. XD-27]
MTTTDTDAAAKGADAEGADLEPAAKGSDDSDLGAAGSQLSTAPAEDAGRAIAGSFGGVRQPGALGAARWFGREVFGWGRWFWRQLTSMRVALLLLFLLSLASIPGSLIPQTGIDPLKADDFKARHETLTPIYEKLQLFNVYSSVWFSAIYILLFVSLIGCIVPRTWQFVGQLRGRPPAAPRRLTRLPAYTTWRTEADPEQVLQAAQRVLKGRRFRTQTSGDAVASEKGYLREAGNLVFHISLIVMLVSFAVGQLWKSEGGKLVVEGDGFTNSLTQYDDIKSGPWFDAEDLAPFSFRLDEFTATYERSGPNKRTPRTFRADVTYRDGVDGPKHKTSIKVNEPLDVAGFKVFLLGHGYAPVVTVRDGTGDIAYRGPVASLPAEGTNLTENVVIKVPDYRDKDGKKDQLAFQGYFSPTAILSSGTMLSQFPALDNPMLFLTAYHGNLGIDSGLPQNVYRLDTSKMKQFKAPGGKGRAFSSALKPGQTMKLPNGAGTLEFEGVKEWATFQISHKPGNSGALFGAVAAVVGLAASLFIQRRRVWVRAVAADDGTTVVEMAGLGRSESAKLPEELADLAVSLQADAPPAPDPDPGPDPDEPADPADPDAGPDSADQDPGSDSDDPADPADPVEGARA